MSRRVKREIAQIRKHRANTRVAERWAAQRMAVDLGERDAENERLRYWLLKLGRDDIVNDADKFAGPREERRRDAAEQSMTGTVGK